MIALLGGGLITMDVMFAGGLVTLATAKAAGGVAGGAATVGLAAALNWLVQWLGFKPVLLDFQAEWKRQRNHQLRAHLREHFARPLLLDALERRLTGMEGAPAAQCALAVAELRQLLDESQAPA